MHLERNRPVAWSGLPPIAKSGPSPALPATPSTSTQGGGTAEHDQHHVDVWRCLRLSKKRSRPYCPPATIPSAPPAAATTTTTTTVPVLLPHHQDITTNKRLKWKHHLPREAPKTTLGELGVVVSSMRSLARLIWYGQLDRANSVLEKHPALLHSTFASGLTPLTCAATRGHYDMSLYLLEKGAQINQEDLCGCSALFRAVSGGHEEVVDLLLSRGANPIHRVAYHHSTPLTEAASRGYTSIVTMLLALPGSSSWLDHVDYRGASPLWLAAEGGWEATCKVLLRRGADFGLRNADGVLPREIAEVNGHIMTANALAGAEKRYLLLKTRCFHGVMTTVEHIAKGSCKASQQFMALRCLPLWCQRRLLRKEGTPVVRTALAEKNMEGLWEEVKQESDTWDAATVVKARRAEMLVVRAATAAVVVDWLPTDCFGELMAMIGENMA